MPARSHVGMRMSSCQTPLTFVSGWLVTHPSLSERKLTIWPSDG